MQKLLLRSSIVGFLTLAFPLSATGDEGTIGGLRQFCAEVAKPTGRQVQTHVGYCIGALTGFENGYTAGTLVVSGTIPGHKLGPGGRTGYEEWCLPDKVTKQQFAAVYVQWADHHPARWHEHYGLGIMDAFKEAWPCKK